MPSAIFLHQHLPIWTSSLAWIAFALLSWTANAIVIYSGMNQMPAKVVKGIHLIVQICKCIDWWTTMRSNDGFPVGLPRPILSNLTPGRSSSSSRVTLVALQSLYSKHTQYICSSSIRAVQSICAPSLSLYYCHACPAFSTCCSISLRPTALLQARCLKQFNTNQTYYLLLH